MKYIWTVPVLPFYVLAKHRALAVFLLVLTVSISPRIHVATLRYGKLLDLRIEDFLIILLTISWFTYSSVKHVKLYISPLGKPVLLYLLLALLSTSVGLLMGWIELSRAFFFYLKEVEYFLMFFLTLNFIEDIKGLKVTLSGFLLGGLANGFYILYQFAFGKIGGMEDPNFVYRYYGVSMLGESGPAITGIYFGLVLFLSASLFVFVSNTIIRLISIVCVAFSVSGLIGSLSRTSILGVIVVLPAFFYLLVFLKQRRAKKMQTLMRVLLFSSVILLLVTTVFGYMKEKSPFTARFVYTGRELLGRYYAERVQDVYAGYFKVIPQNPVTGSGKSITGQQSIAGLGLKRFYGEAHNYYLRILTEMGVVGLFMFGYIMFLIIKFSHRVFTDTLSYFRVIGLTCFICTIFLLVTSLAQDVFIMARTTELFWILVGLTMVAYRWKKAELV